MIAISQYYRLASDFVAKLQTAARENEALRNEVDEQARLNGKGSERESALLAKVSDLQRQLDNARTGWLCETCDGRACEGQRQSELMFAENEALREKVDDWENAVAHALEHRPDEQHCTCVAPLVGKVKQLERENEELHIAVNVARDLIKTLQRDNIKLRAALERLRDCDFVVTPMDRMDAVREIAREALKGVNP
jgi:hypothetical protein